MSDLEIATNLVNSFVTLAFSFGLAGCLSRAFSPILAYGLLALASVSGVALVLSIIWKIWL